MNGKRHIGMMFKCVDKRIVQHLNKELEHFDLTLTQHEVLHYLLKTQDQHDVYQKEIEEYLQSTNPTITGILKRLELKELIIRTACQHDARCKKIRLTPKGKRLMEETGKLGPEIVEKKLTKNLTDEEQAQLVELLDKVRRGLDQQ